MAVLRRGRSTASDARKAFFGAGGDVLFLGQEKGNNFLYRVKEDGSELPQVVPAPRYLGAANIPCGLRTWCFPGRKMGSGSGSDRTSVGRGGRVPGQRRFSHTDLRSVCRARQFRAWPPPRYVNWSPDGKFLYLNFQGSIYAIPLRPGQALPPIPASGFRTKQEVAALPGARLIPEPEAIAGPNPSVYASTVFHSAQHLPSSRAVTEHGAPGMSPTWFKTRKSPNCPRPEPPVRTSRVSAIGTKWMGRYGSRKRKRL